MGASSGTGITAFFKNKSNTTMATTPQILDYSVHLMSTASEAVLNTVYFLLRFWVGGMTSALWLSVFLWTFLIVSMFIAYCLYKFYKHVTRPIVVVQVAQAPAPVVLPVWQQVYNSLTIVPLVRHGFTLILTMVPILALLYCYFMLAVLIILPFMLLRRIIKS